MPTRRRAVPRLHHDSSLGNGRPSSAVTPFLEFCDGFGALCQGGQTGHTPLKLADALVARVGCGRLRAPPFRSGARRQLAPVQALRATWSDARVQAFTSEQTRFRRRLARLGLRNDPPLVLGAKHASIGFLGQLGLPVRSRLPCCAQSLGSLLALLSKHQKGGCLTHVGSEGPPRCSLMARAFSSDRKS
jgi:hypothetical protein